MIDSDLNWSTEDAKPGGEALWLMRLYGKYVGALRTLGGFPEKGSLAVTVPTVLTLARRLQRPEKPPGVARPHAVLWFPEERPDSMDPVTELLFR